MMKCRLAANRTAISTSIISTWHDRARSRSAPPAPRAAPGRPSLLAARRQASAAAAAPAPPCRAPPIAALPNSPHGRHTSTTAITRNSATSVSLLSGNGEPKTSIEPMPMQKIALIMAISTAATKAPPIEPIPPTTTTTKASPISARSRLRLAGSCGICSAPPSAGQEGAEREHRGEEPALVHAEGADHLAILRGGAHEQAPARLRQHQPEQAEHDRADDDREQVVAREALAEDADGAGHARCARAEDVVGTPGPQGGIADDQHERERGQQLVELGRAVEAAQDRHLDHGAERRHRQRGDQHAGPEPECTGQAGERGGERDRRVQAQHEERAVREIDDARHAEDERETARDEEQCRRGGQTREDLEGDRRQRHACVSRPAASS